MVMCVKSSLRIIFGLIILGLAITFIFHHDKLTAQTTSALPQEQQQDLGQKVDEILKNQKMILERLDETLQEIRARCTR